MEINLERILLAFLSCIWLADLVRGFFQRRKVKADSNLSDANATQVIVASATTLLKPLTTRIEELEKELQEARREANKLVKQLHNANDQLSETTQRLNIATQENQRISAENRRLRLIISGDTAS